MIDRMQKETISRYLKLRFADTERSREGILMVHALCHFAGKTQGKRSGAAAPDCVTGGLPNVLATATAPTRSGAPVVTWNILARLMRVGPALVGLALAIGLSCCLAACGAWQSPSHGASLPRMNDRKLNSGGPPPWVGLTTYQRGGDFLLAE